MSEREIYPTTKSFKEKLDESAIKNVVIPNGTGDSVVFIDPTVQSVVYVKLDEEGKIVTKGQFRILNFNPKRYTNKTS